MSKICEFCPLFPVNVSASHRESDVLIEIIKVGNPLTNSSKLSIDGEQAAPSDFLAGRLVTIRFTVEPSFGW